MHQGIPKPSNNRSRRLRKKMQVDEFAVSTIEVRFSFEGAMSLSEKDELIMEFISMLEREGGPREWGAGGYSSFSHAEFVICQNDNSPQNFNQQDVLAIERWLDRQECVLHYSVWIGDENYETSPWGARS